MIELYHFSKCPICSRAGLDNTWREINHNTAWWEKMCSNFHNKKCGFTQRYWKSFDDPTLESFQFKTKDFFAYTYSTAYAEQSKNLGVLAGTFFYFTIFPRGGGPQSPFQVWHDYVPDWDNLDKLNDKLNLLATFA